MELCTVKSIRLSIPYFLVHFNRLQSTLKSVTNERVAIRRDVIDIQAAERDLLLKAYRKVQVLMLFTYNVEFLFCLCCIKARLHW